MQAQQAGAPVVSFQREVHSSDLHEQQHYDVYSRQQFANPFLPGQQVDHQSVSQSLFENGNSELRVPFGAEHPHYGSPNKVALSSVGETSY